MSGPERVATSSRVRLDGVSAQLSQPNPFARVSPSRSPDGPYDETESLSASRVSPNNEKGKMRAQDDNLASLSSEDDGTDLDEEEEEYEIKRQRRIQKNKRLFDRLGIKPITPLTSSISSDSPVASTAKRKQGPRQSKGSTKPIYDRSGYITSLPPPGQRYRIACVEMPTDRGLKKRIAEGEYTDAIHWWKGEDRRWKVGNGTSGIAEGEEAEIGGVTKDFRWRKWLGLEKELRKEMKARNNLNKADKRGVAVQEVEGESSAYSLLPGDPCHQCRRKSEKPKMRCRNVDPVCRAVFCETCCKRYSYFDFDPDSRSFICPLCKDCCNCANCIRKRKLSHLLGPGKLGVKRKEVEKTGMTVQAWLEAAVEDKVGIPFDRVRLVDQEYDFVSPDLPPEPQPPKEKVTKRRKRKAQDSKEPKEPTSKKAKKGEDTIEQKSKSLVVRLKIPQYLPKDKEKEIDSDGDTIDPYSDDEADAHSDASSKLTSLSSHSPVPLRTAWTHSVNDYLAHLTSVGQDTSQTGSPDNKQPTLQNDKKAPARRKPPPIGNIFRAPKHASYSPRDVSTPLVEGEPVGMDYADLETPFTSQSDMSGSWATNSARPVQTFSYDGYSNVPPMLPPQPMMGTGSHYGHPPPYSHSPPTGLPTFVPNPLTYNSFPPIHSVQPVRPFGRADLLNLTSVLDGDQSGDLGPEHAGYHKDAWVGENGLMLDRRYHPTHP